MLVVAQHTTKVKRPDLTPFGFTPTESLVYHVLLTSGPGTGYAVARAAGLARANTYAALEGLIAKGAARAEVGRPKRYRPESPTALTARISTEHGLALEHLNADLQSVSLPASPTLVELESPRATLQLASHEVARAARSVVLLAPPDAFPLLAPALRRPALAGLSVELYAAGTVDLGFAPVETVTVDGHGWPGSPFIVVVDDRSAILASRDGNEVRGHWSAAPAFVAAARMAIERFRMTP